MPGVVDTTNFSCACGPRPTFRLTLPSTPKSGIIAPDLASSAYSHGPIVHRIRGLAPPGQ